MLWSPYVIGHTIIFSSCGFYLSIFYLFFPRLISAVGDWMSTVLRQWCGPSANLECRSETCCARLAGNTGRKKVAKNRNLGTIAQICRAISSQLKHVSTIGKQNLFSSNMSSTCTHNMVNLGPLTAEIGSGVWGIQQISTGFASCHRYCSDVELPEANQTFHDVGPSPGLVHYIHLSGGSCP